MPARRLQKPPDLEFTYEEFRPSRGWSCTQYTCINYPRITVRLQARGDERLRQVFVRGITDYWFPSVNSAYHAMKRRFRGRQR